MIIFITTQITSTQMLIFLMLYYQRIACTRVPSIYIRTYVSHNNRNYNKKRKKTTESIYMLLNKHKLILN